MELEEKKGHDDLKEVHTDEHIDTVTSALELKQHLDREQTEYRHLVYMCVFCVFLGVSMQALSYAFPAGSHRCKEGDSTGCVDGEPNSLTHFLLWTIGLFVWAMALLTLVGSVVFHRCTWTQTEALVQELANNIEVSIACHQLDQQRWQDFIDKEWKIYRNSWFFWIMRTQTAVMVVFCVIFFAVYIALAQYSSSVLLLLALALTLMGWYNFNNRLLQSMERKPGEWKHFVGGNSAIYLHQLMAWTGELRVDRGCAAGIFYWCGGVWRFKKTALSERSDGWVLSIYESEELPDPEGFHVATMVYRYPIPASQLALLRAYLRERGMLAEVRPTIADV